MSTTNFLKRFLSLFTKQDISNVKPSSITYAKKPKRRRIHSHAWLSKAMADMNEPGVYYVEPPKTIGLDYAQTLLCQRLRTRFGKGRYSTNREATLNRLRVYIIAS